MECKQKNLIQKHNLIFKPHGVYHNYAVVGEYGAIHFHFIIYYSIDDNNKMKDCGMEYAPGLEIHYKNCPSYMNPNEPSQENCWLLDAPCWHDGTSLYASEFVMPSLIRLGVDWLWNFLEQRYEEEFIDGDDNHE